MTAEPVRDREAVLQGISGAAVATTVVVALWLLAPQGAASAFWQDHFPWAHPREPLPFFGFFLISGALAVALWPGTWEGELLARSLRAVGWTFLLYWLLAILLEAPTAAGIAALPLLGGPAYSAFRVARRAPGDPLRPYLAALASVLGALALVLLVVLPFGWVLRFILLPLPVGLFVLGPALILRDVRDRDREARRGLRPSTERPTEESRYFLDLSPGTLRPPASGLGLLFTIATVVFLVLVVAPGVPLSGPIAWLALTLSVPVVVWSVLRKDGIAQPRRIVAPLSVQVHAARVQQMRDADLQRLDDALERFIRTGRGRKELASALAALLAASVKAADGEDLTALLGRLPRTPWRRRAREDGLAHLLGGTGLLASVRKGGRVR